MNDIAILVTDDYVFIKSFFNEKEEEDQ